MKERRKYTLHTGHLIRQQKIATTTSLTNNPIAVSCSLNKHQLEVILSKEKIYYLKLN